MKILLLNRRNPVFIWYNIINFIFGGSMKLKLKNYKNINNLDLNIEEEKINFIFGISGSGKSSLVSAIVGDKSEKNISYGKKIDEMELVVEPELSGEYYLIFNEQTHQKLILNKNNNEEVYSILFENDNSLEAIRKDISILLANINSKRQELSNYVQNVDQMIKIINKRKLSTSGKFSSSSSLEKLKSEIENPKYKKYSNFIHDNGLNYVKWIESGANFSIFNEGKCPFCTKKMSKYRIDKIEDIIKISPEQYGIISDSQEILNKIGINVPNFSYKREVIKLEKDLYDAVENKRIIENLYNMVDSYNLDSLDIKQINKITFSKSLNEMFPEIKIVIDEFNDNIIELKKKLCSIKLKTSKFIGKNLKKLNDYLSKFSIPYEFEIDNYNTMNKTATVFLVSKKEKKHEDKIDNLSYGEKNIIALLLFLVSTKKQLIIIDDPASSYDDNRRKVIYELLYEFHDNQTYIILSHDQVFIKYALLGLSTKKYLDKTGRILCLENIKGECSTKNITTQDFDNLQNQVMDFMKNNDLSYYRKIINLRILAELNKNSKKSDKLIYSYLSAILHNTSKSEIIIQLTEENVDETEVLKLIDEKYKIILPSVPDDIYIDFDYSQLTNFEKIAYKREEYRKKRGNKKVKTFIEKEFDDIIHLNDRYFISLNPYKFDVYSENIYENIL